MHVLLFDCSIPRGKLVPLSCCPCVCMQSAGNEKLSSAEAVAPAAKPTPALAAAKGKTGLKRFRRMARIIASQLHWTKDLVREAEEHLKAFVVPNHGDGGEDLSFNVHAFKRDIQPKTGISSRVKAMLIKNGWERTEEELTVIARVLSYLKCFSRYSSYVKKELAKIVTFQSFEQGRVVVRQGDIGFSYYFIIQGSVFVEVQDKDAKVGSNHIIGELGPGASFGELALINQDSRRRATIVCKENCEFLIVDKPNFDIILRIDHENEWETRQNFFSTHPIFQNWEESQLSYLTETSVSEEYNPGSVIMTDLHKPNDFVHFIMKGRCKIVQAVKLPKKLELPEISDKASKVATHSRTRVEDRTAHDHSTTKWWMLRTLTPGDYFGVGEGDPTISVVADEVKVECLKVRRLLLMKHDRGKLLATLQREAAKHYPQFTESYSKYADGVKWRQYKTTLVKEIAKTNKKDHPTALKDVPKILVLESPRLYR